MISPNLNEMINEIIGKLFVLNRIFDRAMSVLAVTYKAISSTKILHPTLAHFFLNFADSFSEHQQSRNMLTRYPATPEGNQNYENPLEFYEVALEEFNSFEDMLYDAINLSISEKDFSTEAFLKDALKVWKSYIETMNNIVDVCRNYGNDPKSQMMFDDEIENCLTVPNLAGD